MKTIVGEALAAPENDEARLIDLAKLHLSLPMIRKGTFNPFAVLHDAFKFHPGAKRG